MERIMKSDLADDGLVGRSDTFERPHERPQKAALVAGVAMTTAVRGARLAAMSEMQRKPPGQEQSAPRRYVLDGHPTEVARLAPGLHIVATPIGNLGDITLRALATLAGADLLACSAIATPLTPYHDPNAAQARPALLRRLAEGAAIALVSDAGTPLISDPGFKLVRAAHE